METKVDLTEDQKKELQELYYNFTSRPNTYLCIAESRSQGVSGWSDKASVTIFPLDDFITIVDKLKRGIAEANLLSSGTKPYSFIKYLHKPQPF